jgi:RHS repeat-associated protein
MTAGGGVEKSYFDPFGARVGTAGQAVDDPEPTTTNGFTGHEQDEGGLINMRGRIYDRSQYRFLTPDPLIAAPLFGQSYNPYSYALNNPLRYWDPSGFQTTEGQEHVGGRPAPPPEPVGRSWYQVKCTGGEYCKTAPPDSDSAKPQVATDGNGGSARSSESYRPKVQLVGQLTLDLPRPPGTEPPPISGPDEPDVEGEFLTLRAELRASAALAETYEWRADPEKRAEMAQALWEPIYWQFQAAKLSFAFDLMAQGAIGVLGRALFGAGRIAAAGASGVFRRGAQAAAGAGKGAKLGQGIRSVSQGLRRSVAEENAWQLSDTWLKDGARGLLKEVQGTAQTPAGRRLLEDIRRELPHIIESELAAGAHPPPTGYFVALRIAIDTALGAP